MYKWQGTGSCMVLVLFVALSANQCLLVTTAWDKSQWNCNENTNKNLSRICIWKCCLQAWRHHDMQTQICTLQWRHNDHDGVSNHQPHGCLLNRLFRCRSKKTSKLCITGLYAGNSPGPVNSPHKGPVTRKMFPFDDVIMITDPLLINLEGWIYRLLVDSLYKLLVLQSFDIFCC